MKPIASLIGALVVLYLAGYLWHRSANSVTMIVNSSVTNGRLIHLAGAVLPPRTNFGTQVIVGPLTTDSEFRYCVFYVYYPLGRLETLLDRRDYVLVDSSKPGTIRDIL